jgi:hypothetical protein
VIRFNFRSPIHPIADTLYLTPGEGIAVGATGVVVDVDGVVVDGVVVDVDGTAVGAVAGVEPAAAVSITSNR